MSKQLIKYALGWGVGLWLIGYILGIILFMLFPAEYIGWIITPVGVALTIWVLTKKIKLKYLNEYLYLAIIWTALAIILDYLFILKLLNPADGYYKPDVYL